MDRLGKLRDEDTERFCVALPADDRAADHNPVSNLGDCGGLLGRGHAKSNGDGQ